MNLQKDLKLPVENVSQEINPVKRWGLIQLLMQYCHLVVLSATACREAAAKHQWEQSA